MDYQKMIDETWRELIFEDDMTEEEYQELIQFAMGELELTNEALIEKIKIGEQNGVSVEEQLKIAKSMIQLSKVLK